MRLMNSSRHWIRNAGIASIPTPGHKTALGGRAMIMSSVLFPGHLDPEHPGMRSGANRIGAIFTRKSHDKDHLSQM